MSGERATKPVMVCFYTYAPEEAGTHVAALLGPEMTRYNYSNGVRVLAGELTDAQCCALHYLASKHVRSIEPNNFVTFDGVPSDA